MIPTTPVCPNIDTVFKVLAFTFAPKTVGAVSAFAAKRLPCTCKDAPPVSGFVPIPITPVGPKMANVFVVEVFTFVVYKLVDTIEFDTKTLPWICRAAPPATGVVPIPMTPAGLTMAVVLAYVTFKF